MIYYVTFDTQRNRCTSEWIFHCEAKNALEAKETAKLLWAERGHKEHMFHLYAKKSRIQDMDLLKVRQISCSAEITHTADGVMNHFIKRIDRPWLRP